MEIEDLLRRFELPGPPPGLRGRILAAARPRRPWRLLAAAAAALAVLAVLNVAVERRLEEVMRPRGIGAPDGVDVAVPGLDGLDARSLASSRRPVSLEEIRRAREEILGELDGMNGAGS